MRRNSVKFMHFSQPSAKYCVRCFIYMISVNPQNNLVQQKEHPCFTYEEMEVSEAHERVTFHSYVPGTLVQPYGRSPSVWFVPLLFRGRKDNCSASFQTSVTLPMCVSVISVDMAGELTFFLPPQDIVLGLAVFCYGLSAWSQQK